MSSLLRSCGRLTRQTRKHNVNRIDQLSAAHFRVIPNVYSKPIQMSTLSRISKWNKSEGSIAKETMDGSIISDSLPQSEININSKLGEEELMKYIHYIANHLFPINDIESYEADTDISESQYKLAVVKGGITNLLYLMTPKHGDGKKLLVRVYGENTEHLIDRAREEVLFYELGELSFGPKCYGIFGNGRVEQWYDNVEEIELHQTKYYEKIAGKLGEMHSINPTLLKNETGTIALWKTIDKWYNIASNITFDDNPTKQMAYNELNWMDIYDRINLMKSILPSDVNNYNENGELCDFITSQQSNQDAQHEFIVKYKENRLNKIAQQFMTDSVFSHNDLLSGNVLHLGDIQEIKFIDFEYGSYNFRGFDFANHFCEYAGFDCEWKLFPSRDHIGEFVTNYIESLYNKNNLNDDVLNLFNNRHDNDDYNEFLQFCIDNIIIMTCVDHFWWGLWGVVQSKYSPIDFDFIGYANGRLIGGYQYSLTLLPEYLQFIKTEQ